MNCVCVCVCIPKTEEREEKEIDTKRNEMLENMSDGRISPFDCNQNRYCSSAQRAYSISNKIICSKSMHTDTCRPLPKPTHESFTGKMKQSGHKNCQNILFLVLSSKLAVTQTRMHTHARIHKPQ